MKESRKMVFKMLFLFRKLGFISLGIPCLWFLVSCSTLNDHNKESDTFSEVKTAENSAAPFTVEVWTDKNHFKVGEPITVQGIPMPFRIQLQDTQSG